MIVPQGLEIGEKLLWLFEETHYHQTDEVQIKFKKSDDQTNIDKYRVAANITEYIINQNYSSSE